MAHARLSPSSAERWVNCPASVGIIERRAKKETFSEFAAEGSAAHDLAERSFKKNVHPEEFLGVVIECDGFKFTVDMDMVNHVAYYMAYVRENIDETAGDMLEVEQKLSLPYSPKETGTADVVGYRVKDKTLVVIDLKYGRGVKVEADGNLQLLIYAYSAYIEWRDLLDIEHVEWHISQPRLGHHVHEAVSVFELRQRYAEVEQACELVDAPNPPFGASEKGCRFCPINATCMILANHNLEQIGLDFDDLTKEEPPQLESPAMMSADQVGIMMGAVDMISSWLKSIEGYVHAELSAGRKVPGYKLVVGRSIRKWTDEEAAKKALRARFKVVEIITEKLISPAAADKLIKADKTMSQRFKNNINALIVKPEGKPSLAKESDKRPPIDVDVSNDFDAS